MLPKYLVGELPEGEGKSAAAAAAGGGGGSGGIVTVLTYAVPLIGVAAAVYFQFFMKRDAA